MYYNVDLTALSRQLLPPVLRSPLLVALLKVLVSPIVAVYSAFQLFRDDTRASITSTGNVISLEYYINKLFLFPDRKITISTPNFVVENIITMQDEQQPTIYLRNISEESAEHYFYQPNEMPPKPTIIVHYPNFLDASDVHVLREAVERYKPVGRRYELIPYDYE